MCSIDLSQFEYHLPQELIAQAPAAERDASRLLVLNPDPVHSDPVHSDSVHSDSVHSDSVHSDSILPGPSPTAPAPTTSEGEVEIRDRRFSDLADLLRPGSLLVFNDTRVFPARLFSRRATGGRVEILLVRQIEREESLGTAREEGMATGREKSVETTQEGQGGWSETWEAMLKPARRLKEGETLQLTRGRGEEPVPTGSARVVVGRRLEGGELQVQLQGDGAKWADGVSLCAALGETPLPPYIRRPDGEREGDRERYQTVFAERAGAVAAPTAGLHFTQELLERLEEKGVETANVTLHVGPGTFRPIKTSRIQEHVMHREWFQLPAETVEAIRSAKRKGRDVVAVGTTTVRVLESSVDPNGDPVPGQGDTRLFIYPGFEFNVVDRLITNFHLPRSSLLLLVAAFAGTGPILQAYRHAVQERYRFYSYGDAMLIL